MQGYPALYNHFSHILYIKRNAAFGMNLLHLVATPSTILRNRNPAELKVQPIKEEMPVQNLHVFKSHFNSEMFLDFHEYLCYL